MHFEKSKWYFYLSIRDESIYDSGFDIDVTFKLGYVLQLGFKFTNHEGWCGIAINVPFFIFNVGYWKK